MAADPESDEWVEGVRTFRIPQKHLGIGIGTSRQGPLHCITSIQAGSTIARIGNALVSEPSRTLSRFQPLQSCPEYTPVSFGIADPQGNAQTISVLKSPSKTSQISWARAVKLLTDRRRELKKTIRSLTKDEEKEFASLSLGEAAFVSM